MLKGFNKKFFGSYLKDLRTSLGLTQLEVFKITNITTETLRRIENGISLPQFRTLEDLSIAYKKRSVKRLLNNEKVKRLLQLL